MTVIGFPRRDLFGFEVDVFVQKVNTGWCRATLVWRLGAKAETATKGEETIFR